MSCGPRGTGALSFRSIEVKVDGQTVRTQRLLVQAQNPSETENFKLRLSLSKEQAYVGGAGGSGGRILLPELT